MTRDAADGQQQRLPEAQASGSLPDIRSRQDIEYLVEAFYDQVVRDSVIGPHFTEVARIDMTAHLPIMADFWESNLLRPGVYRRNALQAHRDLHAKRPVSPEHFDRWLGLWTSTVHQHYSGPTADRAIVKAHAIAHALYRNTTHHAYPRP
jgi:hemoglobin